MSRASVGVGVTRQAGHLARILRGRRDLTPRSNISRDNQLDLLSVFFCTLGWVMNMYSLLEDKSKLTLELVEQNINGNLSRCTDYRPVLWKIVLWPAHHHAHAVGHGRSFKTSAFFAKALALWPSRQVRALRVERSLNE